ncbi:MAG: hypothetical protein KBS41_01965, partial [Oscillospiraceae bacterium]|nr:hypothetical protein [Candidatus Equicaccousia limihippi]
MLVKRFELERRRRGHFKRPPPAAEKGSAKWRSGRELPSECEMVNFRAPQEGGLPIQISPAPPKRKSYHESGRIFALYYSFFIIQYSL